MRFPLKNIARFALLFIGGALFIGACAVAGRHWLEHRREKTASQRWAGLEDAARAEGRPLIQEWRLPKPAENLLDLPPFAEWQKDKATWEAAMESLNLFTLGKGGHAYDWEKGEAFKREVFERHHDLSIAARLEESRPVLEPIRTAGDPLLASRLPRRKSDVDSPPLILRMHAVKLLKYSALMALENGESEAALRELLVALKLGSARGEETAITYLVQISCHLMTQEVIATGLARHQWNGEQVGRLRDALEKQHPLRDLDTALQGEIGFIHENLANPTCNDEPPSRLDTLTDALWPGTGVMQSRVFLLEFTQRYFPACLDGEHVDLAAVSRFQHASADCPFPHVQMGLDVFPEMIRRGAAAQSWRNLALLACRLELYWQEHGVYPENIADLPGRPPGETPDPVTGEPLRYRRLPEGDYLLYSVGWKSTETKMVGWLWMLPGLPADAIAEATAQQHALPDLPEAE